MTVYFKAIFGLLVTEIVTLTAILGPLPLFARKQLVKIQTSTNYVIGALSYGVKLGLIANTVFFVDSVHRVRTLTAEEALGKLSNPTQMNDVATAASFRARKVYAQRNMYLTGFCLFLAFVIVRVFTLVANETLAEERVMALETARTKAVKLNADAGVNDEDVRDEINKEKKQKAALDTISAKAAAS